MRREFLLKIVILLTLLIFTACGGSSKSENNVVPDNGSSVIKDDTNSEENNTSATEEESTNEENNASNLNSELDGAENNSTDNNTSEENNTSNTEEGSTDTNSTNGSSNLEDNNVSEENSDTNSSEVIGDGTMDANTTDQNATETNSTLEENSDVNLTEAIQNAKAEPYFKYAWHIDAKDNILNEEGYTIDSNADINLTAAWELSMGEGVKVAVIDDGADVEHEDLKENVLLAYNVDNNGSDINPNLEDGSHGNTCAGFIAAPINEKGIVGISPKSKLIAIRQEEGSDEKTIRAFQYAKENGAKVISCSWGTENVSEVVVSQLKDLYDSGITVVFASGNDGKNLDDAMIQDESEVEWVIGIGATGENNDVTSYSNYGENIDIMAPGGDTQLSSGLLGLDDTGEQGNSNQLDKVNNNYAFTDGTSFATPIVAGVIALMYDVNPDITPKEVREILIKTADKVGTEVDADYSKNNFDSKRAFGKINAGKAVLEAKQLAQ
jgi:subtilisin family serine protease